MNIALTTLYYVPKKAKPTPSFVDNSSRWFLEIQSSQTCLENLFFVCLLRSQRQSIAGYATKGTRTKQKDSRIFSPSRPRDIAIRSFDVEEISLNKTYSYTNRISISLNDDLFYSSDTPTAYL